MSRRKPHLTVGEGPSQDTGPERRCVVSGRSLPKEAMIRFVVGPEGGLVADVAGRLPGRGFWLSADRDVINKALAGKHFAKAARRPVAVPDDLVQHLERMLKRRCLDIVGLARRAGQIAVGFEKVQAALRKSKGGVLVAAADAARDGRGKIRALAPELPLVDLFDAAELGAAVGRNEAVHMAIEPGRLADALLTEATRLAGVRDSNRRDAA